MLCIFCKRRFDPEWEYEDKVTEDEVITIYYTHCPVCGADYKTDLNPFE